MIINHFNQLILSNPYTLMFSPSQSRDTFPHAPVAPSATELKRVSPQASAVTQEIQGSSLRDIYSYNTYAMRTCIIRDKGLLPGRHKLREVRPFQQIIVYC